MCACYASTFTGWYVACSIMEDDSFVTLAARVHSVYAQETIAEKGKSIVSVSKRVLNVKHYRHYIANSSQFKSIDNTGHAFTVCAGSLYWS